MSPIVLLRSAVLTFSCLAHVTQRVDRQAYVPVTLLWTNNAKVIVINSLADGYFTSRMSGTQNVCCHLSFLFWNCVQHHYCFHLFIYFYKGFHYPSLTAIGSILPGYENQIAKDLLAKPQRIYVDLFVLTFINILWIQINFANIQIYV